MVEGGGTPTMGNCARCGGERDRETRRGRRPFRLCASCAAQQREGMQARRAIEGAEEKRRANGAHLMWHRERIAERRERHVCTRCGVRLEPGYTFALCEMCRERNRIWWAEKRARVAGMPGQGAAFPGGWTIGRAVPHLQGAKTMTFRLDVGAQKAFEKLYKAFRARERRRSERGRTHARSQAAREIIQAWSFQECPATYDRAKLAAHGRLCVYLDEASRAILTAQALRFGGNRSSAFRAMATELAFGVRRRER